MRDLMDVMANSFANEVDDDDSSSYIWSYTKNPDGTYEVKIEEYDDGTEGFAITDRYRVTVEEL